MNKSLIVNFFGAPGNGKSTCAAYCYSALKKLGYSVEMVQEFTKDLFLYTGIKPPYNQAFVFGNQLWRIEQCAEQFDIVIVDSPLLLSAVYNDRDYLSDHFMAAVIDAHNAFNNLNFLLTRSFPYREDGRYQSEEQSILIQQKIIEMLEAFRITYSTYSANSYEKILNSIMNNGRY